MQSSHVLIACVAIICACSTPPRPLSPDGSVRQPVNTPQAIAQYRAQLAAAKQQPPDHHGRIQALEREVSQLRQQLAQLQPPSGASGSQQLIIDGAIVEALPQGLRFRIPQPFGKAQCAAGPQLRQALSGSAALSHQIEIRGHTDAEVADTANQRLAARRARCARALLLATGIPAARLHSTHLAAGGFVADNRTTEGRALNRRIDIEMRGLPMATLQLEKLRRSTAP